MSCTFCKKNASNLALHYLCEMCQVHLQCCEETAENHRTTNSNRTVPDDGAIWKAECDICLEEYPENELQEHREMCMARLVFQCTVCSGEYVSKEGLWNHLDLHEITEKRKQSHFKELRVTHKLHKCVLCNDQRGYQESHYWDHVHEDHDGFFLRCSECGDCFRSQKLKTDHAANHCKAREQTVPLSSDGLNVDQRCPLPSETVMSCDVLNLRNLVEAGEENSIPAPEEKTDMFIASDSSQNSQLAEKPLESSLNISDNDVVGKVSDMPPTPSKCHVMSKENSQLVEDLSSESSDTKCLHCGKCWRSRFKLNRHIENCHKPYACDICGTISSSKSQSRYHKMKHREPRYKCPQCPMMYLTKQKYRNHLASHVKERTFPCPICGYKFGSQEYVHLHMKRVHYIKNPSKMAKALQTNKEGSCDESTTVCTICEKTFDSADQFQEHKLNCSRQETSTPDPESNLDTELVSSNASGNDHMSSDQVHVEPREESTESLDDAGGSEIINEPLIVPKKLKPLETTKCPDCDKECFEKLHLDQHMEFFHEPVDCGICGISISSRSRLQYHKLKYHSEPKYKCPHCPRTFHLKPRYRNHLASHINERKFTCELCGNKFKNLHYVSQHMSRIHHVKGAWKKMKTAFAASNEQEQESREDSMTLQTENVASSEEATTLETALLVPDDEGRESSTAIMNPALVDCIVCGMSFASTDQLQDHKLTCIHQTNDIPNMDAEIDSSNMSSNVLKRSDQEDVELRNKEGPVGSVYPNSNIAIADQIKIEETSLSLAANSSSESSTLKCSHCNKLFQNSLKLKSHNELNHKPTACSICGKISAGTNKNSYHRLKHHGVPKHTCPHCPMTFQLKSRYRIHLASHVKERKFACELCGNKFKNMHYVSLHMSRIHGVKGAWKMMKTTFAAGNEEEQDSRVDSMTLQTENVTSSGEATTLETALLVPVDERGESLTAIMNHDLVDCIICGKSFASTDQLQDHKLTCIHQTDDILNTDVEIDLSNMSSNSLKSSGQEDVELRNKQDPVESVNPSSNSHIVDQIKIEETSLSLVENSSSESSTPKCSHCNKLFQNNLKLISHIELNHKPAACSIGGKTSAGSYKNSYQRPQHHEDPKHKCPHCPKKYRLKDSYETHLASHAQERKYACQMCGRKFKNQTYVGMHMRRTHHISGGFKKEKALETGNEHCGAKSPIVGKDQLLDPKLDCSRKEIPRSDLASNMHIEPVSSNASDNNYMSSHQDNVELLFAKESNESLGDADGSKISNDKPDEPATPAGNLDPVETIKCPDCNKEYEKSLLTQHITMFHEQVDCDICGISITSRSQLDYHKLINHANPKLLCPYCPRKYHVDSHLRSHFRYFHVGKSVSVSKKSQLDKKQHKIKPYKPKCPHCDKFFKTELQLTRHVENFHESIVCGVCGFTSTGKSQDQYHKLTCAWAKNDTSTPTQEKASNLDAEIDSSNASSNYLINSDPKYAEIQVKEEPKETNWPSSDISMATEEIKIEESSLSLVEILSSESSTLKCVSCNRHCKAKGELILHIENCHESTRCDICGTSFAGRNQYRYHKLKYHGEPMFKCSQCPRKFLRKQGFMSHLASHVQERKFSCEMCGQKFKTLDYVCRHMYRIHHVKGAWKKVKARLRADSKQKPQPEPSDGLKVLHTDKVVLDGRTPVEEACQIAECNDDNLSSKNDNLSLKTTDTDVLEVTAEKIVQSSDENSSSLVSDTKCPHCLKQFHNKVELIRHIENSHEPTVCDVCGTTSTGRAQNRYHMLKYHKDPRFKCSQCSKKFLTIRRFRSHLDSHVKENKFPCEICGQKFKNLDYVSLHMSRSHKVKAAWKKASARLGADNKQKPQHKPCDDLKVPQRDKVVLDGTTPMEAACQIPESNDDNSSTTNVNPSLKPADTDVLEATAEKILQSLDENSPSSLSETKCPHCLKQFHNKLELIRHIENTHEPIVCNICGTTLVGRAQKRYHKLKYHNEPKFKCSQCPMQYLTKQSFRSHLASHVKEKKVPCEICGLMFKNLDYVSLHMSRSHKVKGAWKKVSASLGAGNKQMQDDKVPQDGAAPMDGACQIPEWNDDNSSTSNENPSLKTTDMDELEVTDEKNVQSLDENSSSSLPETNCPHCSKQFNNKTNLICHIKNRHEPTVCDICGTISNGTQRCRSHKLKHHTEPQFKCPHCSMEYYSKHSYQVHLSSHSAGKKVSL